MLAIKIVVQGLSQNSENLTIHELFIEKCFFNWRHHSPNALLPRYNNKEQFLLHYSLILLPRRMAKDPLLYSPLCWWRLFWNLFCVALTCWCRSKMTRLCSWWDLCWLRVSRAGWSLGIATSLEKRCGTCEIEYLLCQMLIWSTYNIFHWNSFVLVAVETIGTWGSETRYFLWTLVVESSGSFLIQRVSVAVNRGNAASLMGTLAPGVQFWLQ